MKLQLYDITRCQGSDAGRVCPQRDHCRRYTDIHPGGVYAWAAHLCRDDRYAERIAVEGKG